MTDWRRIGDLLHTADLARQWPNLKHIHDAAMAELEKPLEEPVEPADEPEPTDDGPEETAADYPPEVMHDEKPAQPPPFPTPGGK